MKMHGSPSAVLDRIDTSCDLFPRVGGASVIAIGQFEMFAAAADAPSYARPCRGASGITLSDIEAVRSAQRMRGLPEAIEWIHDTAPDLAALVASSGLDVLHAPLLILDRERFCAQPIPAGLTAMLLVPEAVEFRDQVIGSRRTADIAFGSEPEDTVSPSPSAVSADDFVVDRVAAQIGARHAAEVIVVHPVHGIVARGEIQCARGVAEIVGVGTLPEFRRRGLGGVIAAMLAEHALASGNDLVFLSAAGEAVARVYERIGFVRTGTACIAEMAAPAD